LSYSASSALLIATLLTSTLSGPKLVLPGSPIRIPVLVPSIVPSATVTPSRLAGLPL